MASTNWLNSPELRPKAARDLLVISPNSPKHLTIRKGKWVYIPARDEGGFQGKQLGNHLLAGAAAQPLTGWVNSDIENGKIKKDAPPAQLYNLESDPRQANNVYAQNPEVVTELSALLEEWRKNIPNSPRLGWINLNPKSGAKPSKPKKGAPKIPAPKASGALT